MGAKAICRGGGRASAQEQQADNRQQLSGGTLCGRVLLSALGECRERRLKGAVIVLLRPPITVKTPTLVRRKGCRAEQEEAEQLVETDRREKQASGGNPIVCVFTLTVVNRPRQSFHHHLWTFFGGHQTPLPHDIIAIVSFSAGRADSRDGHDSVTHERCYIICGLLLMRCRAGQSA